MTTTSEQEYINFPHADLALEVDQSAQRAVALIDKYSDSKAPEWENPEQIYQELTKARDSVTCAWQALLKATEEKKAKPLIEEDFRAAYMDMITTAFGDCLEDMRNSSEDVDVDVLVECLQSGMDLMTEDEKLLFMQELNGELDEIEGDRSIHDIRREMMGFGPGVLEASS